MEAKGPHHYGVIFRGIRGKRKRDMKILLTLDDNNGLMFNRRRQSRDIVVREKIMELTAGGVEEMILFKWNRKYPCDFRLDFLPWDHGFTCVETEEFQGNSHDKITMEVWRREK